MILVVFFLMVFFWWLVELNALKLELTLVRPWKATKTKSRKTYIRHTELLPVAWQKQLSYISQNLMQTPLIESVLIRIAGRLRDTVIKPPVITEFIEAKDGVSLDHCSYIRRNVFRKDMDSTTTLLLIDMSYITVLVVGSKQSCRKTTIYSEPEKKAIRNPMYE